jgi:hypothetical protein
MTSKFEQLIEYVINDEEAKAKELFHDIVVEKSREIYENLMNEEAEEELDEAEEEELDEAEEEELDENIGGDASDDLIDDVEVEEQGMQMENDEEFDDEAEEDGEDLTHDMEMDHDEGGDIEDRVVDLEDKLDELMAEFESLMGGEDDSIDSDLAGEEGEALGGDALEMDDTQAFDDSQMMENVTLDKVATPKMGDDGANTKSPVAFNSGAKGMAASPVKMTGDTAQGRPAPKTGELIGKVQNSAGGKKTMSPATKPVTTQASGVNTKSPVSKA